MKRGLIAVMSAGALLAACGSSDGGQATGTDPSTSNPPVAGSTRPITEDATALEIRPVLAIGETDAECTGLPAGSAEEMTACDADGKAYTLGPAMATAADVISAAVDPAASAVTIQLGPHGAAALLAATTYAIDASPPRDHIALVSEGAVLSAPSAQSPISDGLLQISGLDREHAAALAARLSGSRCHLQPTERTPPR